MATEQDPPVSASVPDWSREYPQIFWKPTRRLLRTIRRYQAAKAKGGFFWGKVVARRWFVAHRFWSIITGAEIPLNADIAGGLQAPHPNGIVISYQAHIGPNCLLFQQVTIDVLPGTGAPRLGGNVDVGPGAKILGDVVVGDYARIMANSVVLNDVPPGAVVAGNPARVISGPELT